ncbi:MAG: hypothetical protein M1831_000919 [Alyxoria varia]|nr:MAG: hypothetical protein M1831_000919 [Alyxoria varia]
MVKKAIDSRIPALIRNGAQEKKRSFFVVVGDRQKDVIVNLYHILLNVDIKLNKNVLWAYKNKLLGFTSHRKKREKKIKKEIKRGIRDPDTDDPFELFVSTQNIRYVYYKETDKIMGNTFGMCILQDFEAITPNLLARTIETVEGGGVVLLLLKGMQSLKQLYTLSMDIHSRYRTEAHADVTARFNERFILSLGSCESCLVVDDELNVLPISGGKSVKQLPPPESSGESKSSSQQELERIKQSLEDTPPVGSLVTLAKTVDQAKALLTFVDAIAEKTLQSTVALTAARGRGKSAALGVAVAAAIAHGYSNIFITSPSPENLRTLFEFVFKGFDALGYVDHVDYSIIQSTNPDFNKAIVRVNVHRQHRQTIQYIQPQDSYTLGQAELVIIDEAAAIPLPLVRKLMGPYLVFMASTINGYEGTGRSLSLKLINQLRQESRGRIKQNTADGQNQQDNGFGPTGSRSLREITLSEPIRYSSGDSVEKWLNRLLCLDATLPQRSNLPVAGGVPDPKDCELLAVNRDTLFSFHPVSERFLHSMLSLYVASHYKNSPNDLQLMSDAPAHHLYVLVPPTPEDTNRLPEPLCVIQVALEGQISKASVQQSLARGQRAGGDLIPWLVSQQFQDDNFAGLSGARIVRVATNPDYIGMGYGRKAVSLLLDFYSGKSLSLSEMEDGPKSQHEMVRVTDAELESSALHTDNVKIRDINAMPPLFARLSETRPPQSLDYVGVSYGLTQTLHKFWKSLAFVPVYLRQTANDLTGEYTCVMLRTLPVDQPPEPDDDWLSAFARDFHGRFLSLLSYNFRQFPSSMAISIDESAGNAFRSKSKDRRQGDAIHDETTLTKSELDRHFGPHDLRRLDSYASNMLDYHVILDLLPSIALLYFSGSLRNVVQLTGMQSMLLLAIGCQRRDIEDLAKELDLANSGGVSQLLAMFVKLMRKVASAFKRVIEGAAAEGLPDADAGDDHEELDARDGHTRQLRPLEQSIDEDLADAPEQDLELDEAQRAERDRKRAMIDATLDRYEAKGAKDDDDAWRAAEQQVSKGRDSISATVSVKKKEASSSGEKRKAGEALVAAQKEAEKSKERSHSGKKRKGR